MRQVALVPRHLLVSRLWAVWNEPSSSGRSLQGELVRYFQAMASSVRR